MPKAKTVRGVEVAKEPRSCQVRARIASTLKDEAETIFERVGLNPSEAVRLFYTQVTLSGGLPFEVKIPNAETIKSIEDIKAGRSSRASSVGEMLKKIGI